MEKKEILKSNYVVIDLSEEENKHTWTLTGWDEEQKPFKGEQHVISKIT